jgi:hypothetical protein
MRLPIEVVAEFGLTIFGTFGPLILVQVPVPEAGVLPAMITDVPQIFWSTPAFAVEGTVEFVSTT